MKVLRARIARQSGAPGTVLAAKPLTVACGKGSLILDEVVPEGSRPMEGSAWAAGRRFRAGTASMADARRAVVAALMKQEQNGYSNLVLKSALAHFPGDAREKRSSPPCSTA